MSEKSLTEERLTEKEWLARVPEGCTPKDAQYLREANHAFAAKNHRLSTLLRQCHELLYVIGGAGDELERDMREAADLQMHIREELRRV